MTRIAPPGPGGRRIRVGTGLRAGPRAGTRITVTAGRLTRMTRTLLRLPALPRCQPDRHAATVTPTVTDSPEARAARGSGRVRRAGPPATRGPSRGPGLGRLGLRLGLRDLQPPTRRRLELVLSGWHSGSGSRLPAGGRATASPSRPRDRESPWNTRSGSGRLRLSLERPGWDSDCRSRAERLGLPVLESLSNCQAGKTCQAGTASHGAAALPGPASGSGSLTRRLRRVRRRPRRRRPASPSLGVTVTVTAAAAAAAPGPGRGNRDTVTVRMTRRVGPVTVVPGH
jgi:hypothetical protein